MNTQPDPKVLSDIIITPMPFGKYKGTLICNLPVSYLEWFASKGFPQGSIGMLLQTTFVIKTNGLDEILYNLKKS